MLLPVVLPEHRSDPQYEHPDWFGLNPDDRVGH